MLPFNDLPDDDARAVLLACLSVPRWAEEVLTGRPYVDRLELLTAANAGAASLSEVDLEAALTGHPRIGERAAAGHNAAASASEQAGVDPAEGDTASRLAAGNAAYEQRFGHVFLIRAAGRDAAEVLAELDRRLANDDAAERAETIDNLRQIAVLRLEKAI